MEKLSESEIDTLVKDLKDLETLREFCEYEINLMDEEISREKEKLNQMSEDRKHAAWIKKKIQKLDALKNTYYD